MIALLFMNQHVLICSELFHCCHVVITAISNFPTVNIENLKLTVGSHCRKSFNLFGIFKTKDPSIKDRSGVVNRISKSMRPINCELRKSGSGKK